MKNKKIPTIGEIINSIPLEWFYYAEYSEIAITKLDQEIKNGDTIEISWEEEW